jgi:pimeloyl-ACP methyl ester carboxylesterase
MFHIPPLLRRAVPLAGAILLALPQSGLASQPTPQSPFYRPPRPLPAGRHGDVIRARRIPSPIGHAGRMTRLLYRSVDQLGRPVAVSGTLLEPAERPPKSGWPLISWAHGTTGIADICAPSLSASAPTSPIVQEVDSWVKQGYAVASTDYAGLGTPSAHAYLMGRAEGRNVIDIALAARHLDRHISRSWVAAGHSQGGQAALFAAADAGQWAPQLRLRGVAAFAPASHIGQLARTAGSLTSPSPLSGYAALILQGAANGSRAVKLAEIESDQALALRPLIERRCLADLEKPDAYGALSPAGMFRPGADLLPLYRVLDAQNPAQQTPAPVRLFQGDADSTVPKALTDELAKELRAKHDRLGYTTYAGVGHVQVVAAAASDALRWLRAQMRPRR